MIFVFVFVKSTNYLFSLKIQIKYFVIVNEKYEKNTKNDSNAI
jgi:hypothetical protein